MLPLKSPLPWYQNTHCLNYSQKAETIYLLEVSLNEISYILKYDTVQFRKTKVNSDW